MISHLYLVFAPIPSTVPKKVTKDIGKIHKISLPDGSETL